MSSESFAWDSPELVGMEGIPEVSRLLYPTINTEVSELSHDAHDGLWLNEVGRSNLHRLGPGYEEFRHILPGTYAPQPDYWD